MAHDEIRITLSDDEIEKFKLLDDVGQAPLPSDKPLIQMVPQILRSCYGKEDCARYFKPTSVVIGPLNHERETDEDSRIKRGNEYKLTLAAVFIQNSNGKTEKFYKNVKEEINSLRSCYNLKQVEEWSDEDLAWMFLVDGCALLGFIVLDVQDALEDFSVDNDLVSIDKTDFFLLENQLPFKLLEILIGTFAEISEVKLKETKLMELSNKFITKFIKGIFLSPTEQQQHQIQVDLLQSHHPDEQQQKEDPPHLLDLLRRRLMGVKSKEKTAQQQHQIQVDFSQSHNPDEQQQQEDWRKTRPGDESKHWSSIGNVKELKDKGIRFKAKEKGAAIIDIDFNDHCWVPTLTLAPIFLHNTTIPLLLNLMAYELCPDFKENWKITSHLSFLDSLIDDGEDVKDLRVAGVVHNGLGSDEAVAELFNKISGILVPNREIDSELRRDIYRYCNSKRSHCSRIRAIVEVKLTQTYFKSPWSFFVFLGALAGLIMTGMQTYKSFH